MHARVVTHARSNETVHSEPENQNLETHSKHDDCTRCAMFRESILSKLHEQLGGENDERGAYGRAL